MKMRRERERVGVRKNQVGERNVYIEEEGGLGVKQKGAKKN